MGFFDDRLPPGAGRDDAPDIDFDELFKHGIYVGGVAGIELVLARTDRAAVVVRDIVAFPDGFEVTAVTLTRPRHGERREQTGPDWFMYSPPMSATDMPDECLRFGVEFPDGTSVTSLDEAAMSYGPDMPEPDAPHGMQSINSGGSGEDRYQTYQWWVWPLPADGALTFVCEWPAHDIPETRVTVDGGLVRAAAARAELVWPDLDGPSHLTYRERVRRVQQLQAESDNPRPGLSFDV